MVQGVEKNEYRGDIINYDGMGTIYVRRKVKKKRLMFKTLKNWTFLKIALEMIGS